MHRRPWTDQHLQSLDPGDILIDTETGTEYTLQSDPAKKGNSRFFIARGDAPDYLWLRHTDRNGILQGLEVKV